MSRQTGSHRRLSTRLGGKHHVTIPQVTALRVGTLAAIRDEVARHLGEDRMALAEELFPRG